MTNNQINYQRQVEEARHNVASEAETSRHNVMTEGETQRHDVATESETNRHNVSVEMETSRHNIQEEGIGWANARANQAKAQASMASASAALQNAAVNAAHQRYLETTDTELRRQSNAIAQQQANARSREVAFREEEAGNKSAQGWANVFTKGVEIVAKYGLLG